MTSSAKIDSPDQSRRRYAADCAGAQVHVYARSLATVLRIEGEIDASNAERIAQEIRRFARLKTPLILDLSHLNFLAIAGFRALLMLNHEHKRDRLHCSVIPGPAMRPLLRIITDHGLALADSVPEALQLIDDVIRTRRQFLSDVAQQRVERRTQPLLRVVGGRF